MNTRTKTAEFSLDPRGFLRVTFLDTSAVLDEEEAREHIRVATELTGGAISPVLVDARENFCIPTIQAKEMLASVTFKSAEAIVTNSLAYTLLGNFYQKITLKKRKDFPIKLFREEADAIEWLMEMNRLKNPDLLPGKSA